MRRFDWLALALVAVCAGGCEDKKAKADADAANARADKADADAKKAQADKAASDKSLADKVAEMASLKDQMAQAAAARDAALAQVQSVKDKAGALVDQGSAAVGAKEQALKDEMAKRDAQYAAEKKALTDRANAAEQKAASLQKSVDDLTAKVAELEKAVKSNPLGGFGGGK